MGSRGLLAALAILCCSGCVPGQRVNRTPDWPASDGRFRAERGVMVASRCVAEPCDGVLRVGLNWESEGSPATPDGVLDLARRFAAETFGASPDAVELRPAGPVSFRGGLALYRDLLRPPAFAPRSAHATIRLTVPAQPPAIIQVYVGEQADGRETRMVVAGSEVAAQRAVLRILASTRL